MNFYDSGSINPYVAVAARGPWVVTMHGAVVHDNGGYGMLGFGHNAAFLQPSICLPHARQLCTAHRPAARPQVMANVMTACFAQKTFFSEWRKQVGFTRKGGCPYSHIMTMNSGSEAVELSTRLSDKHAKLMTDKGAVHEGKSCTDWRQHR